MNEDRPMSAFAGIAACLALPGRSGVEPLVKQVDQLAAARRQGDAGSKGRRWLLTRGWIVVLALMTSPLLAAAQVSVQIGLPGINIGINQPVYPQLVQVPGYPVYYDPGAGSNYFFYDGMYWVYAGDNWYASSWYNGPWSLVGPQVVPVFLLRVPVRYYRQPPVYFRGWGPDAPPRWGEHWGNDWERQRGGWDRWDHASAPRPAPLPVYQKEYSGNRYPHPEQQQALRSQNYRYQPADAGVKQVERAQAAPRPAQQPPRPAPQAAPPPAQAERKSAQPEKSKQQPKQQQQQQQQRQQEQARPAQQAPRPAPQAAPPPAQAERKSAQPEKSKQQPQQQQQRQQEQARPAPQPPRPAPQAAPPPVQAERKGEPGQSAPQPKQSRAPQQDEGPRGNSAQAKGQERGQDHDR